MPKYHGWRYIFLCIDVYTSFLFGSMMKSKTNKDLQEQFEEMFKKMPRPQKLEMDEGNFTS